MAGRNVLIFDTTLRDGEQSPGCSMNLSEKLQIAAVLEELRVDIIEAGFPATTEGDFRAVEEIAHQCRFARVAALCRAVPADLERGIAAVRKAQKPRIHTFIATSPIHMRHKLRMDEKTVLQKIHDSISLVRRHIADIEWSAEDASRSDYDFLCRAVETAIKAGATTINLPDTVGYAMPADYAAMFAHVINNVPNSDKAVFSAHCHNDLGLAVANSLAAVQAGAGQIECTINGIGERAGNAALEEIAMAIRTRHDILGVKTGIDTTKIMQASRTLADTVGFHVQPNKAIVGANAFAHESGIHQDGMLKNPETYEIMTPESVGLKRTNLVLGKHSGRHAFKDKLQSMGYMLNDDAVQDAFVRFKHLCDHKKEIYEDDIIALVAGDHAGLNETIRFESLHVIAGSQGPQTATLDITIDGQTVRSVSEGNGPVDATFNAINRVLPVQVNLVLYQVQAVTKGTDAQAEVTVRLEFDGRTANGLAADCDTLVASAKAYIHALNKLPITVARPQLSLLAA
jgi:2-isopropylmalate synthase